MHGRITPSFVEELRARIRVSVGISKAKTRAGKATHSTSLVQMVKIVQIGLAPPEAEIGYFEIAPKVAKVVAWFEQSFRLIRHEVETVVFGQVLGMQFHEILGRLPETWNGVEVLVQCHREAIGLRAEPESNDNAASDRSVLKSARTRDAPCCSSA